MKNSTTIREITDQMVDECKADFCPFGWMDIKAALQTAIEAGKHPSFVYEEVEEFSTQTGTPLDKCDPVYCVYESILQEARNEIDGTINFDFLNDSKADGEIYTAGNFMCTSYDYTEAAKQELEDKLKESNVELADLSEATQYFLSEVGIEL